MVVDVNYWMRVVKKSLTVILTIILVYLVYKVAVFYLHFLIAFVISLMLKPGIKFLMKKFKFKRKSSSIIMLIIVFGIIVGLLAWAIPSLISESSNFLGNINDYVSTITIQIQKVTNSENLKKLNIPDSVIKTIENSSKDLLNTVINWVQKTMKSSMNFVSSIPTICLYLVITLLSLYFLCTDKVYMVDQLEHHLPEIWVKKLYKHLKGIIKELGNYLKAEGILILISFVISLIGLYIFYFVGLNVKYPLLYALGIGFVDALPIFGSGTIMIPWAIVSACYGDIKLGIAILALWIIMSVVRQFLEPRVV